VSAYPEGFADWPEDERNAFFADAAARYRREQGDARHNGGGGPRPFAPLNGEDEGKDKAPLPKLVPIRFVEDEKPQPRGWIVHDGWIPTRKTTLRQGDGGDGKTSLVQQLQSSCATALPWLGSRVEECASVGFYSEEEGQDLVERQAHIDASLGQHCASTGKLHLFPRVDEESELIVFDRAGNPSLTPFYHQVREASLDVHARLAVLDVAVDLFGGDEISRRQVRAFMRHLNRLAREMDGAVVLTSHLSQVGIKSDGGHSGSTDWSNAVRSRLYLGRPKPENGDLVDDKARILTRKKANFASIGDAIKLQWRNGVIVLEDIAPQGHFRRPPEDVFLALLDAVTREGQKVSPKPKAGNYAPAIFMRREPKEREDYRRADFERAMQRLFERQRIKIASYGPPSRGLEKLMRTDDRDAP
jgi:AAA domain